MFLVLEMKHFRFRGILTLLEILKFVSSYTDYCPFAVKYHS